MAKCVTDMETWLSDYGNRIFRFLVYKKLFTPYEQEHKFMDESQFEDTHYSFGYIEEAIDLGGDWLLGFRRVFEGDSEPSELTEYYKLSDIQLSYSERDQLMLNPDYDEEDDST